MDKTFRVGRSSRSPLNPLPRARPTRKRPLDAPSTGVLMVVSTDRPGSWAILNLSCMKTDLIYGVRSSVTKEKLVDFKFRHLSAIS